MSTSMLLVFFLVIATSTVDERLRFKIMKKRDQDRVEVKLEKDKVTFSIQSPSGISSAVIERTSETWPDAVLLRMHLRGLENFEVTNGKVKLAASVSSQDRTVRLWQGEQETTPLNRQSPYWMQIRLVGRDGKPVETIPLEDGYFEMQLPKACFELNPKSITVTWIDFYRN